MAGQSDDDFYRTLSPNSQAPDFFVANVIEYARDRP
jgi:hypothetical protein